LANSWSNNKKSAPIPGADFFRKRIATPACGLVRNETVVESLPHQVRCGMYRQQLSLRTSDRGAQRIELPMIAGGNPFTFYPYPSKNVENS